MKKISICYFFLYLKKRCNFTIIATIYRLWAPKESTEYAKDIKIKPIISTVP